MSITGYDFEEHGSRIVVTDKRNGATATVSLNILHCSCVAFNGDRYRKPCQHIEAAAKLYPEIEQLIAEEEFGNYIEQQAEEVAPDFVVGDRVRVKCVLNSINQKRLGVVTALSKIGIDTDLIVKFDDTGEHKRCEPSQAEKWGTSATPVQLNPALAGYRFGARTAKQNAENWRLVQALKQQLTPEEARASVFGY